MRLKKVLITAAAVAFGGAALLVSPLANAATPARQVPCNSANNPPRFRMLDNSVQCWVGHGNFTSSQVMRAYAGRGTIAVWEPGSDFSKRRVINSFQTHNVSRPRMLVWGLDFER